MGDKGISRREFVGRSVAAAAGIAAGAQAAGAAGPGTGKILNHNENMEYRRCGRTNLMVSAVCLGGHWKRVDKMVPGVFKGSWLGADLKHPGFQKNRHDVVSRCIDAGINYIDACTIQEVEAYTTALKGRREKMYLGCSWYQREMRNEKYRTKDALLETLEWGMKTMGLDYVDLWRITMHEQSGRMHTEAEVEQMMKALEAAKKQGKVRFTGFSSHDRPHIKWMIETYPEVVDIIVTPYTAKSKALPKDSLFEALRKYNVGFFGIKPFASNSLFKGDSSPTSPEKEDDDRRARLAIRYILCNPDITAPIPGMINTDQVDNVAKAVTERRELDEKEAAELKQATDEAWAKLPEDYQWLKDWEYV